MMTLIKEEKLFAYIDYLMREYGLTKEQAYEIVGEAIISRTITSVEIVNQLTPTEK